MKYIAVVIATIIIITSCSLFSKYYTDIKHLASDYEDYVILGRFGDNWPAKVDKVLTGRDEISFALSNRTKHSYPRYYGFELKAVFLYDRNGNETVVVLRSKEKIGKGSVFK